MGFWSKLKAAVEGVQPDPTAGADGESLGDDTLRTDVWNALFMADQLATATTPDGGDPCPDRRVTRLAVLDSPEVDEQGILQGPWSERWTVDRCGVEVAYVIEFRPADDGGIAFEIGEFELPR